MRVERWTVDDGVAGSAVPAGVSAAAVAEAGYVPDEDLIGAELVSVGASTGRLGDHWPSVVWTSSPSSTFRSLLEIVLLGVVHVPGEAARVVPARDDGVGVRGRAADLVDGARQGAALSIRVENGDPVVAAVSLSGSPVVAGHEDRRRRDGEGQCGRCGRHPSR